MLLLLKVLSGRARGDDPEPKSTPSDLGVDSSPTLSTPDTSRDRKTRTETDSADTGGSTATPVAPTTPPATGGTGGTTATPVAPAQPEGPGGGAGQPAQPAPAPTGEGGGAAAPPGD